MKRIVEYWKRLSDYDMRTADSMRLAKRYPYCLFMCHLSIEKILKALVAQKTGKPAPFTHNLVDLAKRTGLDFSGKKKELLADLTEFNLEARYPEWQKAFYKRATKEYTLGYYTRAKTLQKWLKKNIKNKK